MANWFSALNSRLVYREIFFTPCTEMSLAEDIIKAIWHCCSLFYFMKTDVPITLLGSSLFTNNSLEVAITLQ